MTRAWTTLDRVASAAGELELRRRGEREFLITVAGRVLMTSAAHRSECALAVWLCEDLTRGRPRVLIGGLGMGYTLSAALDALPRTAAVRVSAEEGYRLGFVNEVVPAGEALAGARRWADQILECAPLSVRASKQSAYQGLGKGSVEEACKASYDQVVAMVKSQDFIEGPRAFAEKRDPVWKGR